MKRLHTCIAALLLSVPLLAAAADSGKLLRAAELRAKPFSDAAVVSALPANTVISVLRRQGAWAQIEVKGQQGWVKVLNIVTDSGRQAGSSLVEAGKVLTTGSSGRESSAAVKGVSEESLKKAKPAPREVEYLETLGSSEEQARRFAKSAGLDGDEKLPFLPAAD